MGLNSFFIVFTIMVIIRVKVPILDTIVVMIGVKVPILVAIVFTARTGRSYSDGTSKSQVD